MINARFLSTTASPKAQGILSLFIIVELNTIIVFFNDICKKLRSEQSRTFNHKFAATYRQMKIPLFFDKKIHSKKT